jgi:gluconokinase
VSDPQKLGGSTPSRIFVFMGVCGAGKSTMAQIVAKAISGDFLESDALHPPANVAAMRQGRALTDAQRWPWLEAVCDVARASDAGRPVMIACSALARRYRDFIRVRLPGAIFIHLHGSPDVIRDRMLRRPEHFMPPDLLDSQLATLESPQGEPDSYSLNVDGARDAVIAQAISICRRHIAAMPQGAPPAPVVVTRSSKSPKEERPC